MILNISKKLFFQCLITLTLGCGAVSLGLQCGEHFNSASPIWPATGLFILITTMWGYRQLPIIFASYFLTKLFFQSDLITASSLAFGSMLQSFIGAYLLKHSLLLRSESIGLKFGAFSIRHFSIGLISALTSALIGSLTLYNQNIIGNNELYSTLFIWTLGDYLGYLFLVPMSLEWKQFKIIDLWHMIKSVSPVSLLLLILSSFIVFYPQSGGFFLFLIFFSLVYFVLKNSKQASFIGQFVLYIITIIFILNNKTPSLFGTDFSNLFVLQIILLTSALLSCAFYEFKIYDFLDKLKLLIYSSIIVSNLIFFAICIYENSNDKFILNKLTSDFENSISQRMESYIDALSAGKAFILTDPDFNVLKWQQYIEHLDIINRYPGINGIGAIKKVPKNKLEAYLHFSEDHLLPGFKFKLVPHIDQRPDSEDHYIISLIEPFSSNQSALGLDVASEANRKSSADLAFSTNKPFITKKIVLVQDEQKIWGFLLFIPIQQSLYKDKNLKNRNTFFDYEWVYAPFVTENFLRTTVNEFSQNIRVKIFDQEDIENHNKTPIFDNQQEYHDFKPLTSEHSFKIGQQDWHIHYMTTPDFSKSHLRSTLWIFLLCNIIVILLASLVGNMILTALNAESKAQKLSTQLFQSAQMSALGEMAGGMAHEINNPLTIIKGRADHLRHRINGGDTIPIEVIQSTLTMISCTSDRISKIVSRLLTFSQTRDAEKFQSTSIEELLPNSLNIVRERLVKANIEVRETEHPKVMIDCKPLQISQVLYHLISNSIDALENLSEKWIEIEYLVSSKNIEIRITDSGKGIPKEISEKIMLPFFTTKAPGKGSGMGLSECKGIINSHFGEFYLNTLNQNTSFVIKLPLAKKT